MLEMIPIQKENIDSIGYNEDTNKLHIKFIDDSTTYFYKNISIAIFVELLYSKEKDKFLKENVFSKYEKIAV